MNIDFFSKHRSYNLHILQFLTFFYSAYRLLSRDYAFYGHLGDIALDFPRAYNAGFFFPLAKYTTFTFIYEFIDLPSYNFLNIIQTIVLLFSLFGIFGILPRFSALLNLLFYIHMTGIINGTNAELEGGTVLMSALFVCCVANSNSLYSLNNRPLNSCLHGKYNWPIKLLLFLVGSYYTMAGINKVFDVGPHWPIVLNLENLAITCLVDSITQTSRFSLPWFCQHMTSPVLSNLSGGLTLVGELFFITVVFRQSLTFFFVPTIILMHLFVYLSAGINFLGSSLILIACLDWNNLILSLKRDQYKKIKL